MAMWEWTNTVDMALSSGQGNEIKEPYGFKLSNPAHQTGKESDEGLTIKIYVCVCVYTHSYICVCMCITI